MSTSSSKAPAASSACPCRLPKAPDHGSAASATAKVFVSGMTNRPQRWPGPCTWPGPLHCYPATSLIHLVGVQAIELPKITNASFLSQFPRQFILIGITGAHDYLAARPRHSGGECFHSEPCRPLHSRCDREDHRLPTLEGLVNTISVLASESFSSAASTDSAAPLIWGDSDTFGEPLNLGLIPIQSPSIRMASARATQARSASGTAVLTGTESRPGQDQGCHRFRAVH